MKNLFVAISDIHFNLKNLSVAEDVSRQALLKARELKVPFFCAGDLHDTKSVIRAEEVIVLLNLFKEFSDVDCFLLIGNHELTNKNSNAHALEFLREMKNVVLIDKPCTLNAFPGFKIIPYQKNKQDFLSEINKAKEENIGKILAHQGVSGAFMGSYVIDESSIDPKELESFEFVGLGHYHKHQKFDAYMYWGSPYTCSFGEAGEEKFFWQVYEVDGKIHTQPHLTNVRRHIQFTIDEFSDKIPDNIREHDLVKIIRKGPKEFALAKEDYSHIRSKNITVVPEIERQSEVRIKQEIANSPIKVLEKYLEDAVTMFDRDELKQFLWETAGHILNGLSSKTHKNIKVTKVKAENFLSFNKLEYEYTSKGLTLIEGHDEDNDISTGAGKSSFLDVICYGLFGETSKNLKADEVINRSVGKDLSAHIELKTDHGTMLVVRNRKHHKHENDLYFSYADGDLIRGKDNRETQKLLEEELGINFDSFLRSSYFSQFGSIDKFLSSSDSEKKAVISEICDTVVYEDIVVVLKEKLKDLKANRVEAEKESIQAETKCESIKANVLEYKERSNEFINSLNECLELLQANKEEWDKLHSQELKLLCQKSDTFEQDKQARLSKALKEVSDWDTKETITITNTHKEIEGKLTVHEKYKQKSTPPQDPNFQAEIIEAQSKLSIVQTLEGEEFKLGSKIDMCQATITSLEIEVETAKEKSSSVKCSECFQLISKEHIEKQVKAITLRIGNEERDVLILRAKKSDISESIKIKAELEARVKEMFALEYEYKVKKDQAESNRLMALQCLDEIERLKGSLENRPNNPHNYIALSIGRETNQHAALLETKKKDTNPYISRIEEEGARKNPYQEMLIAEVPRLEEAESSRALATTKIAGIDKDSFYALWWRDGIHIYIKSYLTDSFLEQINVLANDTLIQIFDGLLSLHISATREDKKKTKEKITVMIYNKNEECSYNSLSGGERCRICFALNLAIRKVTDVNLGFLMFDEILNGLDDVGKAQVMKVLKELEAEYESVFVIDHTTEFKSLFTNSIMIKKINGVSSITS